MEQMNQSAMVAYENKVADYLRSTENHVRYRVTLMFYGEEMVCRGVQMEAQSIEDNQQSFNIFIYNIEIGVTIEGWDTLFLTISYITGRNSIEKNIG